MLIPIWYKKKLNGNFMAYEKCQRDVQEHREESVSL